MNRLVDLGVGRGDFAPLVGDAVKMVNLLVDSAVGGGDFRDRLGSWGALACFLLNLGDKVRYELLEVSVKNWLP